MLESPDEARGTPGGSQRCRGGRPPGGSGSARRCARAPWSCAGCPRPAAGAPPSGAPASPAATARPSAPPPPALGQDLSPPSFGMPLTGFGRLMRVLAVIGQQQARNCHWLWRLTQRQLIRQHLHHLRSARISAPRIRVAPDRAQASKELGGCWRTAAGASPSLALASPAERTVSVSIYTFQTLSQALGQYFLKAAIYVLLHGLAKIEQGNAGLHMGPRGSGEACPRQCKRPPAPAWSPSGSFSNQGHVGREGLTSVALSALSRANTMALQMSVLDTVMARSRSSNLHATTQCIRVFDIPARPLLP